MKRLSVVFVAVVALALSTSNLMAQEGGKKKAGAKGQMSAADRLKQADKDGDGFLSAEELAATLRGPAAEKAKEIFALKDANKDGKLSQAELGKTTFEEFALRYGVDPKAGKVTLDDVKKNTRNADQAEKMFKMRDRNGDGVVSKEDFERAKGKAAKGGKGGKRGKKADG